MELSKIMSLVDAAKLRARNDQLGFLVIGFEYSETGEASGHTVLGRVDSREEAVELAGSRPDCAYILDEDELAFGLIPRLLAELIAKEQRTAPKARHRPLESPLG